MRQLLHYPEANPESAESMEIIVIPYMVISFSIAWAIFSPFAEVDGLNEWTFARLETSDLLAIFLPVCFLLATLKLATPTDTLSALTLGTIAIVIVLFSAAGLVSGLYLLAKMRKTSSAKRMAIIGIIMPLGSLLTIMWVALPLMALAGSILFAIPAAVAVVPLTWSLRILSKWVCDSAVSNDGTY